MRAFKRLAGLLSLLLLVMSATVQSSLAQALGANNPFGSYMSEGFDTIDLSDLNVHFTIPIINKNGRKVGFFYNLQYDSQIWVPTVSGSTTAWTPIKQLSDGTKWGWSLDTDANLGLVVVTTTLVSCMDENDPTKHINATVNRFGYYEPAGSYHSFAGQYTGGCPDGYVGQVYVPSFTTTIADGSGLTMTASGGCCATITTKSGLTYTPPVNTRSGAGSLSDTNANTVTVNSTGSFIDSTGTTALTIAGSSSSPPRTYQYPVVGGAMAPPVTVNYAAHNVRTNFQCSGITEYGATTNLSANLISSIVLPNGAGTYAFTYETTPSNPSYTTGRIASITLPTGGVISYTYTYPSSGCLGGIQSDGSGYKITRTTNDGHSTTYDRSVSGTTVATTGDGTVTTVTFKSFYETKRTIAKSGTTVRTVDTCYNGYQPPTGTDCTAESLSSNITEKATYLTLDNSFKSEVDTKYGTFAEPLTVDEYDFGSGAPGSFLRETASTYTYGGSVPVVLTDTAVWSLPGKTGSKLAETAYGYSSDGKGNLTSITNGISGGPQLTSTITPNSYGMPSSTIDPSAQTTTYTYDSTNSFLTTTTLPQTTPYNSPGAKISHAFGAQYDLSTGLLTSSTDQNGNVAGYTYDSSWRALTVSNPDGGGMTYSYPPSTPANIEQAVQKINSTVSAAFQTLVDGFGRTVSTGMYLGTSEGVRQDTCYDVMGRVLYVSSPYTYTSANLSGTPSCPSTTSPGDSYSYDTLGRVTQIQHVDGSKALYSYQGRATEITEESNGTYARQRIVQYDAIGRLTGACELLGTGDSTPLGSAGNPVTCNMDISANGYPTTYSNDLLGDVLSVTQPGVSTARSWTYDQLQRVTQEITPEAGTINYFYVANGSSGAGQLSTVRRSVPNTTSGTSTIDKDFSYDELGRPYAVNYYNTNSSPLTQAANTPSILYLYDKAPGWGSATSNLVGNLTGIWTLMPGATVPSSGDAYDYDSMNRVVHNGQCTPNTCTAGFTSTPVLMTYAYNYAGTPTTFTNGKANVTFSYGVDATGRLNQVTSSLTGTNYPGTLLSNVLYGPYGPVSDTLGNGVAETYGYGNPGSGQVPYLNSVTAKLGATSIYGLTLGISGNGFVKSANDSVNGNWSYGYDSFDRLSSASKTGTAINWKYDVPGNRWQQNITTGSGPAPKYTFTGTNQISTATYDLMGNLLKDFAGTPNQYTYDAEGRVYQVNSGSTATYVYDGFGRRVKGPDYEYTFDLSGNPATLLNPTTDAVLSTQVYVGTRQVASYFGGGAYFTHVDHLGTLRARTDHAGTVCQTTTSLPFGDARTSAGSCYDSIKYAIGGYEYDSETTLDKTQYRQYYSTPGQWMTPDPAGTAVVDSTNPQTWNRYAYVANNPLNAIDPKGLDLCQTDADGGQTTCDGSGAGAGGGGEDGGGGWNLFNNAVAENDYFYGGQFSGVWSQADMNAWESQQFFTSQGVYQYLPSQQNPAGQSAYWEGQYLRQVAQAFSGDPCVYLNNAGTGVESVDHHSSRGECGATGGQWVPPQPPGTTYAVDANGNAYAVNPIMNFICKSSPSARILSSMRFGAITGAARGGYAGFVGGELLEPLGGGFPGAGVGAFVGGTVGGAGGVISGGFIAGVCSLAGAY